MLSGQIKPDTRAIEDQLDRILRSRTFAASRRSQKFLQYVVDKSLADPGSPPKEFAIAMDVFERDSSYDPSIDATVRVQAGRLRIRLRDYYATEGIHDSIHIDIPTGGYAPVFTMGAPSHNGSHERLTQIAPGQPTPEYATPRSLWPPPKLPVPTGVFLSALALCLLIAAMILIRRHTSRPDPQIRSLAVLPLENLSGDATQDYFADGMTDELITELAHNHDVRVVSRTSVTQEKGLHKSLRKISSELNVDAIVEGSVVRSGDRVRITAQLIDTRTDKHLWAQSFEGQSSDILTLQDAVAGEIASQIRGVVTPASDARRNPSRSIDPQAHDAYLRGRYFFQKQDMSRSADYFQHAIESDPSYASAYAGLADALDAETTVGLGEPQDLMPRALVAAQQAIKLDPENGEAYTSLGSIETIYEWNWPAAQYNLTRGIALDPSNSVAEMKYAVYLDAVGHPEDAVVHMRRALHLDPLSFLMNRRLGATLYLARHYDEALDQLRRAREMEPNQHSAVDNYMSWIYELKGMRDQAVDRDLAALQGKWSQLDTAQLSSTYKRKGWNAYWRARMNALQPYTDNSCAPYAVGVSYLRLGDRNQAFTSFNRAVDRHCYQIAWLRVDPLLDSIRTDTRYESLLQRINLITR